MTICKISPLFELFCAMTVFDGGEPGTLLVDIDILYYWAKLSDDCFCSKICMLSPLVSSFAVQVVTAIINKYGN